MTSLRHRLNWIVFAALVVAVVAFYSMYRRHCLDVARTTARKALLYRSLGIYEPGTKEYVPLPPEAPHSIGAAALGNALFNDKRLVKSSKRVCGTCHPPFAGGTDNKVHDGTLTRSTQNAALSSCYLHDGRLRDLRDVVECMITNSTMGCFTVTGAVARLRRDPQMVKRFETNYEEGLVASNVVDALVQRMRAQIVPTGAFDRYLSGKKDALNEEQIRGFGVFKSASCVDCHSGPALGGRTVENGRKVPALRGIARRKRFMYDGSVDSIEFALEQMPSAQILPEGKKRALAAFLQTL